MRYEHGAEVSDRELFKLQLFAEFLSDTLCGTDKPGDDGMIQEWQEDRAKRRFYHNGLRAMLAVASLLVGVAALMDIAVFIKHW